MTRPLSCICIGGPTASGKSAVAMAVAERLAPTRPVEIVSVDSAQVYRGMDIGTAKPSLTEREAVVHHLIDVIEPTDRYSASLFVHDARRLIGEIAARGALPLLVGGTMLYFKALFDGLDAMPPADPAIRAELDLEAALNGWPAMHAELARVDPTTAARLSPNDGQRVQRALEVYRASGKPLSAWHTVRPVTESPPLVSLEPDDRAWLHARIAQRFADMLDRGFVDEVRGLRARGDLDAESAAMRAVGYRQAWAALDGGHLDTLIDTGTAATRQLAKRQLTWLRSMPTRRIVACDSATATRDATALVMQLAAA